MLFNSDIFVFLFLPVVVLVYYSCAWLNTRAAVVWLVGASLFFYGWWNPKYLTLIIASMIFNYLCGQLITRHHDLDRPQRARLWMIAGIAVNLGALFYFKYFNFFVDSLNTAFGLDFNLRHIILPLAISFFTFQQITYLVDSYKEKCRHYDFLSYALFVTFFPQLIAGPIVHHAEMMPQFQRRETFRFAWDNLAVGLSIFIIGLFKKVILADQVAQFGTPMFDGALAGATPGFVEAWCGALAYTFQLYFDFSGYSDMAIGLARIFGIVLPQNFHSPYRSSSIIDFWRRWHMTLSRFLRDYVYIPLGGNQLGTARRYSNLMTTMLIGGLWHGAAWTFVIWGGLHGCYLLINNFWRAKVPITLPNPIAILVTFTAVVFAWVYFRAESFSAAHTIAASMMGFNGLTIPAVYENSLGPLAIWLTNLGFAFAPQSGSFAGLIALFWIALCAVIAFVFPNTQEVFRDHRPAHDFRPAADTPALYSYIRWQPSAIAAVVIIIMATIATLSLNKPSEFLYFQF